MQFKISFKKRDTKYLYVCYELVRVLSPIHTQKRIGGDIMAENAAITVANIFEEAGNTMSGLMNMTTDFFTGLWANPMGKIVITLGLAGAGIGLCYRLFLRKKHV